MAANRILALNIGASQITLAEFKVRAGESPVLLQYGSMPLGVEPDSDTDSSAFVIDALRTLMKEKGIRPAPLLMSVSGQTVFPRFVKLPPVAKDKILQMVRYEAEQNVPFPIEEVVWDYQLIGDASSGEQNAMIVAIKTESAIALTNCVEAVGMEPEVVDVAPLAIANCVQISYPDQDGCTMVLDIGARSTNLIFLEDGRVFYRTIPVAGNTITQEIAKSFGVDFQEAERMKREIGFVALGGVYASEDETADKLSKVIRNVVTRLHAEINRSINFYRSQQGGTVPTRALLTGGSCTISHMDTFFREKLKVDVDYLNPFASVEIGGHISQDAVGEDFYRLAEVIGLAMRKAASCFVEINLMPPDLVQKKTFRKRIPFLVAGAASMLVGVCLMGLVSGTRLEGFTEQRDKVKAEKRGYDSYRAAVREEVAAAEAVEKDIDAYVSLINQRAIALRRLDSLRAAMLDGMWLVAAEPVRDERGAATMLTIHCRGFVDKLRKAEESAGSNMTAVELFRNRLAAQPAFTNDAKAIEITLQTDMAGLAAKVKEFTLRVPLAPDCIIGKAGE
ncbi:MAG: type IV pilus assembly protein PilM [Kiritimatiellae bacterium]|nr:type IV pilus assembly protein PilM [Kiritimatiellia bacterium]